MLLIIETLWSLCSSLKREEGKGENTMLELLPGAIDTVRSRNIWLLKLLQSTPWHSISIIRANLLLIYLERVMTLFEWKSDIFQAGERI